MPFTQQRELEIEHELAKIVREIEIEQDRKRRNKADAQKRKAPDQDPLGLLLLAMTVRRKGQALDVSTDTISLDLVGFQTVGKPFKSRPLYSSSGAVMVTGSPFSTLADAEAACNTMFGELEHLTARVVSV